MIKTTTIKASLCVTALLLSLGAGVTVQAETSISDTGIAGIATALDNYFAATEQQETGAAEEYIESLSQENKVSDKESTTEEAMKSTTEEAAKETTTEEETDEVAGVVSPYANLGISIAEDYVNIRSEANIDSAVVGKLYRGCATDIIETTGEWVKIHSGNVDGYIKAEYLAIGAEAGGLIDQFATKYATVINTKTLRVREKKSLDSTTTTLIPEGETYYVVKEYAEWVKIMIDDGDTEEGGDTGFVSKEFVSIEVQFQYAVSIEEEQAKLAAEEAAKQAEIERLEELALEQEEERQAEAAQKAAAEKAAQQADNSKNQTSSPSSNSGTDTNNSPTKSSSSASGQAIADYAVKFVGNPYLWGGTSLTNGADCSGFVQSIYSHFGKQITRTSRDQSSSTGYEVSLSNLQAGDLIFYCNSSGSVNHVALYIGNGRVVHASNRIDGIKISSYNYRTPYKARRIL